MIKENTLLINNFELVWDFYKNSIKVALENNTHQSTNEIAYSIIDEKNVRLAIDNGSLGMWKWGDAT